MARPGTYDEQWGARISADAHRFRVRVWPLPPGKWQLRPRNHTFDPCLVFWAMCPMPDGRFEEGVSYRTVWLAFREPPYLHAERMYHDGEAVVVNDEQILRDLIVPGFRFVGTVDGRTSIVKVEVLETCGAAETIQDGLESAKPDLQSLFMKPGGGTSEH